MVGWEREYHHQSKYEAAKIKISQILQKRIKKELRPKEY